MKLAELAEQFEERYNESNKSDLENDILKADSKSERVERYVLDPEAIVFQSQHISDVKPKPFKIICKEFLAMYLILKQ